MASYTDTAVENPKGLALLVPGVAYPTPMPQLYFAKQVALNAGWNVREIAWDADMEFTPQRVTEEVETALTGNELPVLIIGKSIGSLAAMLAAERNYRAIWITPVVERADVVEAIGANTAMQLAIGGTADEHWNHDASTKWPVNVQVLEFPGANHPLLVASDPVRGAEIVGEYTRVMNDWVTKL